MKLNELNDLSLSAFINAADTPAVLTFHAPFSRPARTMLPVISDVAESYEGVVRFALVNTDHAQRTVDRLGILSLPTYVVYKDGKVISRFIGLLTKEKLVERVEQCLQQL